MTRQNIGERGIYRLAFRSAAGEMIVIAVDSENRERVRVELPHRAIPDPVEDALRNLLDALDPWTGPSVSDGGGKGRPSRA